MPPEVAAFSPAELKAFMELHATHGEAPGDGFAGLHSGYNEVILDAERFKASLPRAVEAFFILSDRTRGQYDRNGINVREAHAAYLAEYGRTADEVPLLTLDRWNWSAPFARLE